MNKYLIILMSILKILMAVIIVRGFALGTGKNNSVKQYLKDETPLFNSGLQRRYLVYDCNPSETWELAIGTTSVSGHTLLYSILADPDT